MENQSVPLIPTFEGRISTTLDALVVFEACITGVLNHVPRRPHDRERQDLIKSGSVFIYEEHASGIKRWTDGVSWSPSRILNNFLIYRELDKPFPPGEKKRALKKTKKSPQGISKAESHSHTNMSYVAAGLDQSSVSKDQERSLIGSLVDSYPFKIDGLVKKTISISYQGVPHHLVSYYNVDDVTSGKLNTPTNTPELQHITPRSELFLSQNFRTPVEEVEYALADHNGTLAAQYGPNDAAFSNGSGVLHRAMMQGNLQNAMNTEHQSSSQSAYMFPQHSGGGQNGYSGPIVATNFPAAIGQQMPYASNPAGNYSLDPTRGSDRFASTAAINNEFPRNMPSTTSSRRPSLYDVSSHQSDMSNMHFGSNGTESRSLGNSTYMNQQSYYMPQQRQPVVAHPHTSPFSSSRGLRAESDSIPGDESVSHPYNLDDTSQVWGFDSLEAHDQHYFSGHPQSNVPWPNGPNHLHRA